MTRAVAGLFEDLEAAESAVLDLIRAGFSSNRIRLDKMAPFDNHYPRYVPLEVRDRMREGAISGVTLGMIAGGIIGLLMGIDVILAQSLNRDPLACLLSGVVVGALVGGPLGAIVGARFERPRITKTEPGTLVAILTEDAQADSALDILRRDGAIEVGPRPAWFA